MRIATTILLLSIALPLISAWPFTSLPFGCYTFLGSVKCADHPNSTPTGYVAIFERDDVKTDDFINSTAIVNGQFRISGCVKYDYGNEAELYLEFDSVCAFQEIKWSGFLKDWGTFNYTLFPDKDFAQVD